MNYIIKNKYKRLYYKEYNHEFIFTDIPNEAKIYTSFDEINNELDKFNRPDLEIIGSVNVEDI